MFPFTTNLTPALRLAGRRTALALHVGNEPAAIDVQVLRSRCITTDDLQGKIPLRPRKQSTRAIELTFDALGESDAME